MSCKIKYFSGFSVTDQEKFAILSGDFNPIHLDSVYARRSIWGEIVVHGINQVLFFLNYFLREKEGRNILTNIKAEFIKPLQIDNEFHFSINEGDKVQVELLSKEGDIYSKFTFSYKRIQSCTEKVKSVVLEPQKPSEPNFESLRNLNFKTELLIDENLLKEVYPCLSEKMPLWQVALLTATTRAVGMKCPGLNSIFSELVLNFDAEGYSGEEIVFNVTNVHKIFKQIQMDLSGKTVTGFLKTFLRPKPYEQSTIKELKKLVIREQFKEEKALVVGGSRGIGEVASKMLSIGGADVTITYNRGQGEAKAIVDELQGEGFMAKALHLNILNGNLSLPESYTTLYYFASPFIFSGVKDKFRLESFSTFTDFYIKGLISLVQLLQPLGLKKVFYPSTIAIDELVNGMWEYSASKAAAEHICDLLERRYPELIIYKPRFPRVKTDQTLTLMPIKSTAAEVILEKFFREFQELNK